MYNSDERKGAVPKNAVSVEPLTEEEARRAEAEALQRTQDTSQEIIDARRRGRIEAETRRVSEEMTRQAQERIRLERLEQAQSQREQPPGPTTSGVDQTAMRDAIEANAPSRILPEPAMIERVLVALDGTAYAERALPYAVALAAHANASLVLAHVIEAEPGPARNVLAKVLDPTSVSGGAPVQGMLNVTTYLNAEREHITTSVAAAVTPAQQVETAVVSADTASDGLVALLARTDTDVAVLATHARQGLERRLLGSVGDALIQRTRVPLLLIPPGVDVPDTTAPIFRRILVPLDGSMTAEEALAPVLALATSTARDNRDNHGVMDIVLYHVADSRVTRPDGVRYMEEVRERIMRTGLPETIAVTAAVMVGSPPGSITSAAVHGLVTEPTYPERFDLVAMATHGRGGFQRWLYGSVAEYLLAHLSVPILLVRPEQSDM